MKHDGSMELFHYWNRLRGERAAPKRTEVEPADIRRLLADTFILERDARGAPVFRLAGTRLCATYGRELKGFAFLSMWQPKDQAMMARLADNVFSLGTVVVVAFDAIARSDRAAGFEMLLLPLDGGRENPRLLGIASPASKPYWLGADPILENRIESVRVVDPEREPMFLKNRPSVTVPALAPSRADLTSRPADAAAAPARRVRHLLVIEGGRDE